MINVISNNKLKSTIALAALQNVIDPEIGISVVDLGLIYQIDFEETEHKIFVTMTLTTQFCPMGESLTGAVKRAIEHTFVKEEAIVELTFDPPWTHGRISEEGKQFLNR
ncbi:MAG: metal-sulfur cluster assembly factor [Chitinophagaceae bacterium]|nr:metal-sulfur cluster assembly factor [Chitinophagaceae bacterium]MBK8951240.1 metal-sulfur cluster assembly factor [Chitinophagaceae bacterium]